MTSRILHRVSAQGEKSWKVWYQRSCNHVSSASDSDVLNQVQERFEVDIKELPEQIDTSTYTAVVGLVMKKMDAATVAGLVMKKTLCVWDWTVNEEDFAAAVAGLVMKKIDATDVAGLGMKKMLCVWDSIVNVSYRFCCKLLVEQMGLISALNAIQIGLQLSLDFAGQK